MAGDTAAPDCSPETTNVAAPEVAIMDSCNALKLQTETESSPLSWHKTICNWFDVQHQMLAFGFGEGRNSPLKVIITLSETNKMFNPMICFIIIKATVGRRGTNQLHLLERYLDVLVKHTTEIPPPTDLVEGTAPSALVVGVSLR